jgi:hypothetical protein
VLLALCQWAFALVGHKALTWRGVNRHLHSVSDQQESGKVGEVMSKMQMSLGSRRDQEAITRIVAFVHWRHHAGRLRGAPSCNSDYIAHRPVSPAPIDAFLGPRLSRSDLVSPFTGP